MNSILTFCLKECKWGHFSTFQLLFMSVRWLELLTLQFDRLGITNEFTKRMKWEATQTESFLFSEKVSFPQYVPCVCLCLRFCAEKPFPQWKTSTATENWQCSFMQVLRNRVYRQRGEAIQNNCSCPLKPWQNHSEVPAPVQSYFKIQFFSRISDRSVCVLQSDDF